MDKNGKLFGKISIVDLVVILIILAIAAGAVYRFTAPGAQVARGEATVDFTIRVEGPREFTLVNYRPGLRVYDNRANQFIGHIVDFRYEPHYTFQPLHDGTIVAAQRPGHVNIYLDIQAQGRTTDTAIYVEGTYEITANSVIYIRTRYVEVEGRIHTVSVH